MLLVDGTRDEHAQRVVRRVACLARAYGHVVDVLDEPETVEAIDLEGVEGVVLVSSPRLGRHSPLVRSFVARNTELLRCTPSALVAVSLWAAWPGRWYRGATRRHVNRFLHQLRWRPGRLALVPGALTYTRYGPLRRALLQRVLAPAAGETDTTRDHEFTDWASVDRFTELFLGGLGVPPRAVPAGPRLRAKLVRA